MQLDDALAAYQADSSTLDDLLNEITRYVSRQASRLDSRLAKEDTQDIAQDVTLAIYGMLPRYDGREKFSSLVAAATRNAIIDWRRKLTSHPEHHATVDERDPVSKVRQVEGTSARLISAIKGHLTLNQINLMLAGYTVEEVAELEGISVNVLRNRIARLRAANQ